MNKEEIQQLAHLSKIKIDDSDLEQYAQDFKGILGYIDLINSVEVDEEHTGRSPNDNTMRSDEEAYQSGVFTETLLSEAPQREAAYIQVKKVL